MDLIARRNKINKVDNNHSEHVPRTEEEIIYYTNNIVVQLKKLFDKASDNNLMSSFGIKNLQKKLRQFSEL